MQTPQQRLQANIQMGNALVEDGSLDGFRLLRATHTKDLTEILVMDREIPVAAVTLQPWDEPAGQMARYATVADSHRGRGLMRRLYLHLLREGTVLLSDNERSPEAERLWRWLAATGEVDLTLLPVTPEEGEEGEVPLAEGSSLGDLDEPSDWYYVARHAGPAPSLKA